MKYYLYMFVTFVFLSTSAYAFEPKIEIVEQFDNLRMIAFVSASDISKSPEWNPSLGAPPLSVGKAIQAVKGFVKGSNNSTIISEIELRPVPRHEKHWHYLIKIANDAKRTKYDLYVVLMDGKIIPAIIEPQGYK
jgi:hypothetical protein